VDIQKQKYKYSKYDNKIIILICLIKGMADGRKLSELRVCDLKEELTKRKLETSGSKNALVERLEKVKNLLI